MAIEADFTDIGAELVETYSRAEAEILRRVANRLARGLPADRAQLRPWELQKLNELRAMKVETARLLATIEEPAAWAISERVFAAYDSGAAGAAAELAASGREIGALSLPKLAQTDLAARALAADVTGKVLGTHGAILRATADVYRSVIAQTISGAVAQAVSPRRAAQAAMNRFANQGITSFADRKGRKWTLSTYVDMATRTGAQRAATAGALAHIADEGIDLVMVANIAEECHLCRVWEGQVLRRHAGIEGKQATVADARAGGLFHPNCRHALIPYIEGVTQRPDPETTADPRGDRERQAHRALERDVRKWKRREAAALDDLARARATLKLRGAQSNLARFLETSGRKRQRWRESITNVERAALKGRPRTIVKVPALKPVAIKPSVGPILEGPFNEGSRAAVYSGLGRVRSAFPKAPELRKVWHNPDEIALATKGNDNIVLSSMWFDDDRMNKWAKDFQGILAPEARTGWQDIETPRLHKIDRSAVITHEYGHVLHGDLLRNHRAVNDEVEAFIKEPVPGFEGRKFPRWQVGAEMPSAYAGESPYEFVAEGLTDWIYNGEAAHPSSRKLGEIFGRAYR